MRIMGWADGTGKPDAHIRATCFAKSNTYFVHLTRVTWSFNIDFLVFVRNLVKDLAIQEAQIEIASKGLKLKDVFRNIVGGCSSQTNQAQMCGVSVAGHWSWEARDFQLWNWQTDVCPPMCRPALAQNALAAVSQNAIYGVLHCWNAMCCVAKCNVELHNGQ